MSWAEVSKVNGDFLNAPLDVKMHLADYKMYGEDSYVYQQKELLHGLYECTYLSMNDKELSAEALDYLLKNNKNIGEALSNVYGIERKDILSTLSTMQAVAASSAAMSAVLNSSAAMSAVAASSTAMSAVAASSTAMTAVVASSAAMSAVAASSTAMSAVAASSTAMTAVVASSTAMSAVLNSSAAMSAVAASSTAMSAVAASSAAMSAVAASSMAMSIILNSSNCMLLQNTGLPNSNGGDCYGRFLLVGSISQTSCVKSCSPNYTSYLNNGYRLNIQSPKFGKVYTKIGVPNVPANTIFTMLNDVVSGTYCIVYRL